MMKMKMKMKMKKKMMMMMMKKKKVMIFFFLLLLIPDIPLRLCSEQHPNSLWPAQLTSFFLLNVALAVVDEATQGRVHGLGGNNILFHHSFFFWHFSKENLTFWLGNFLSKNSEITRKARDDFEKKEVGEPVGGWGVILRTASWRAERVAEDSMLFNQFFWCGRVLKSFSSQAVWSSLIWRCKVQTNGSTRKREKSSFYGVFWRMIMKLTKWSPISPCQLKFVLLRDLPSWTHHYCCLFFEWQTWWFIGMIWFEHRCVSK